LYAKSLYRGMPRQLDRNALWRRLPMRPGAWTFWMIDLPASAPISCTRSSTSTCANASRLKSRRDSAGKMAFPCCDVPAQRAMRCDVFDGTTAKNPSSGRSHLRECGRCLRCARGRGVAYRTCYCRTACALRAARTTRGYRSAAALVLYDRSFRTKCPRGRSYNRATARFGRG
jgi:hypothetical protein